MFKSRNILSNCFSKNLFSKKLRIGTVAFLFLLVSIAAVSQSASTPSATKQESDQDMPPHMPPPNGERPSPGPHAELAPTISQMSDNPTCSGTIAAYSPNKWQWAEFRLCTSTSYPTGMHLAILVSEAQYYWGGAWYYNKYPVQCECTLELATTGQTIPVYYLGNGSDKEPMFPFDVPLTRSGMYKVKTVASVEGKTGKLSGMFWKDADSAILLPTLELNQEVGPSGQSSLNTLLEQIHGTDYETPFAYQFDDAYRIPVWPDTGTMYSLREPGTLLVIQNATNKLSRRANRLNDTLPADAGPLQIVAYLLGDTHKGPAKRCEDNSNAVTGVDTKQEAELSTPVQAWGRMGGLEFAINANYFDVRPQRNNQTWQLTQCSVPLGVYYNNDLAGPTDGTHNSPNKYLAGPGYFIGPGDRPVAVDTFFWVYRGKHDSGQNKFSMILSPNPDASAAIAEAKRLEAAGDIFTAFSGTGLIPPNKDTIGNPHGGPDSGASPTTRIGIGYNSSQDMLFIFEGGRYRDGIDRAQLAGIFRSLGAEPAMEVDGGGSAVMMIKKGRTKWGGGAKGNEPETSCSNSGAWCSLPTQPDGKARPTPSWLGLSYRY
jgi:Phosphodiester glycosidase